MREGNIGGGGGLVGGSTSNAGRDITISMNRKDREQKERNRLGESSAGWEKRIDARRINIAGAGTPLVHIRTPGIN